jgi:CheY-like chemotaxis protein
MSEAPVEILLVEDNPSDLKLALHSLQRHKVSNRIHTVRDGAEALDFLSRESPTHITRRDRDPLTSHARQTGKETRSAGRKSLRCRLASLLDRPYKFQQVRVDFILVRGRETVRPAGIINLLRPFDEPGRFLRRVFDWNDLVVLTVHDQCWHIDFLEVLSEVGLGKCVDAVVAILKTGLHAP